MAGYNKLVIIGNLTEDPTFKKIGEKNTPVCNFNVAVNSKFKEKEEVLYMKVDTFNKQAENCHKWLRKGSPVFVEGRLVVDSYETKEGVKKTANSLVAKTVQFLGSNSK